VLTLQPIDKYVTAKVDSQGFLHHVKPTQYTAVGLTSESSLAKTQKIMIILKQKSSFNFSIHGLRGFTAASILMFHITEIGAKDRALWSHSEWLQPAAPFLVSIFFCISGFLITQTLEKHNSLRVFTRNRFMRIYPVFLLLHFSMFVLGPVSGYDWMGNLKYGSVEYLNTFFANLLFLPGIFDLPIAQKNAWSLSYEALFYLLAGIVWKTSTLPRGIVKNICLILEFFTIAFILSKWVSMSFFLIGIGSYLAQKYYPNQLPSTHQMGLISLVISMVFYRYNRILALPFLYIFFLEIIREDGFLSQILKLHVMQFLGTISYSLYLIHPFVVHPVHSIAVKIAQEYQLIGILTMIIAAPLIAILVAWASYELIENRLTKFILAKL
jgi:peptidoglycan/LPS O-acetylase OafA/YrhL